MNQTTSQNPSGIKAAGNPGSQTNLLDDDDPDPSDDGGGGGSGGGSGSGGTGGGDGSLGGADWGGFALGNDSGDHLFGLDGYSGNLGGAINTTFNGDNTSGFSSGAFTAPSGGLTDLVQSALLGTPNGADNLGSLLVNANGGVGNLASLANTLLQTSGIGGNASAFACFNAAAPILGLPLAGGICVTGTGDVWVELGAGAPGLEGITGHSESGASANDILGGGALSTSIARGDVISGSMVSIPSGQTALFTGYGLSPTAVSGSLTYGMSLGNLSTGLHLPHP